MSDKLGLEITIEFWPSDEEVRESKKRDKYLGSLTEFWESVDNAIAKMKRDSVSMKPVNAVGCVDGESVRQLYVPVIGEFIAYLSASGIAFAFYKLAKLWVELKNGRKLKVICNGIEIEATQLTEEQFLRLVKMLKVMNNDIYEKAESGASVAESLALCRCIHEQIGKRGFCGARC